MGNEIASLELTVVFILIAAIAVCIKLIVHPGKWKVEPMTFDLRALKKPEVKRFAEVPVAAKPAIRKCKVHVPLRVR